MRFQRREVVLLIVVTAIALLWLFQIFHDAAYARPWECSQVNCNNPDFYGCTGTLSRCPINYQTGPWIWVLGPKACPDHTGQYWCAE